MESHVPVLLEESVKGLNIKKNSVLIDATADGGGHLKRFLEELGGKGIISGLDWDSKMLERLQKKFGNDRRVKLFNLNFAYIAKVARSLKKRPDAIFFDLGLSSLQLNASGLGFSFKHDEPLLMLFQNEKGAQTAKDFLARASEKELAFVIRNYGEERFAGRIAKAIAEARRKNTIRTTGELKEIIERIVPKTSRIHPATRTFQALRIYLNRELENLQEGLSNGFKILKPEGRIAVISFHSLEDRIVKRFFIELKNKKSAKIMTKKPITPTREEVLNNPRARSAKLRIIEKI